MEVCVDSLQSAWNAIEGGASRLEVCSALSEGGLTPSPGFLKTIKDFSPIPVYAMIRISAGNFVYDKQSMNAMMQDVTILKDHGADGFVFGALTSDNEIDTEYCDSIVFCARPLPVTFHRAFDEVKDPLESLETVIDLGFKRILTSGQKGTAEEGLELIQTLVEKANDRIIIMPGSGITKDNILKIKRLSKAKEFHASAKKKVEIYPKPTNVIVGLSGENCIAQTDRDLVQEMVKLITNDTVN
ncbi:copper homeostasis protein cutC homolog [Calliopsis andreniformis]|uniref:copper homeostasis protein cutC homolog n=1 Tax=Calliopsis andreniformis TaxID=337506 RepID=UPI003FCD2654